MPTERPAASSAKAIILPGPLIFQVIQHDGGWWVEHDGKRSNRSLDKAVAIAAATRLARAAAGDGRPAQVRIEGETGYF
jgi:hypothetical protein